MAKTRYNLLQRQARLQREITHFTSQTAKFVNHRTSQEQRSFTIATRCLNRRMSDLEKIDLLLS